MTRQYTVFNIKQADGLDLPSRFFQQPPPNGRRMAMRRR